MLKNISICEVVTRDGFQSAPAIVSVEDKLKILEMITDAGVKSIEVGAFSNFESMKKMRNTGEVFRRLKKRPGIMYRALVYEPDGTKEAADCGCPKVKINISASEQHHKNGTGLSILSAMKGFEKIADVVNENGMEMAGSISLPFRSPFSGEGETSMDLLKKIIEEFRNIGVYEISLSDSAGLGDPVMIYHRFQELSQVYPDVSWMLHIHNTYGMGMAGVLAAIKAGVAKIDASLSGLGGCPYIKGATGNIATEDLVFMLQLMEINTGIDLDKMIEAGKFAKMLAGNTGDDSYIQKVYHLSMCSS